MQMSLTGTLPQHPTRVFFYFSPVQVTRKTPQYINVFRKAGEL
jgi:hypothetical protein